VATPSDDPVYLYQDVFVGLIPERNLNNGEPAGHAMLIACADARSGEHAVHIGAGVGYYTAILAHMVGDTGRVTAIEYDPGLAARRLCAKIGLFQSSRSVFVQADISARKPIAGESNHALSRKRRC
jgi:protein-L-isoaspartate O-methyltransferase